MEAPTQHLQHDFQVRDAPRALHHRERAGAERGADLARVVAQRARALHDDRGRRGGEASEQFEQARAALEVVLRLAIEREAEIDDRDVDGG